MMTDLADERPACCCACSKLGKLSPPIASAPRRRNERRSIPSQKRCLPDTNVSMVPPKHGVMEQPFIPVASSVRSVRWNYTISAREWKSSLKEDGRMTRRMTKAEARAWAERWRLVNAREEEELRNTSLEVRWQQFNTLLRWAHQFGW